MRKAGVYMLLNIINNQCYVGSTIDLTRRKREHFKALKANKHDSLLLQDAVKKYGITNFQFVILEVVELNEELSHKELNWIMIKNSIDNGYNVLLSGNANQEEDSREKKRKASWFIVYPNATEEDYQQWKVNKSTKIDQRKPVIISDLNGNIICRQPSISEAAKYTGVKINKVQEVLSPTSRRLSYKGFVFTYDVYKEESPFEQGLLVADQIQ